MAENPDALKFPMAKQTKEHDPLKLLTKMNKTLVRAEKLLGLAPGEKAYIRKQHDGSYYFITRNPHDTMLFPVHSDYEGQPRYTWVPQPDKGEGVMFGFLKDEAKEAPSAE